MREAKEDPGLAEVKAVLRKLQRIDPAEEDGLDLAGESAKALMPAHPRSQAAGKESISVFDRKHAAMNPASKASSKRSHTPLIAAGAVFGAAALIFATGIFYKTHPEGTAPREEAAAPLKPQEEGQSQETEGRLVADARRLLGEGDVALARTRLLKGEPESRPDVAFTLAQSYDPNYLQSLAKANAEPDRSEAERWYKKWYELAVQSGLEMDSSRLQRIINAMHSH